jgi:hypothetical protein
MISVVRQANRPGGSRTLSTTQTHQHRSEGLTLLLTDSAGSSVFLLPTALSRQHSSPAPFNSAGPHSPSTTPNTRVPLARPNSAHPTCSSHQRRVRSGRLTDRSRLPTRYRTLPTRFRPHLIAPPDPCHHVIPSQLPFIAAIALLFPSFPPLLVTRTPPRPHPDAHFHTAAKRLAPPLFHLRLAHHLPNGPFASTPPGVPGWSCPAERRGDDTPRSQPGVV